MAQGYQRRDEPGTWVYVPGFFGSNAWWRVEAGDPRDIIREQIAPTWNAVAAAGRRADAVSVQICEGRYMDSPREGWRPLTTTDTYTFDSWRAGEYSTSELAAILTLDTEVDEPERAGILPDDNWYWFSVSTDERGYVLTVLQGNESQQGGVPVPEYRQPTEDEQRRLAFFVERGRDAQRDALLQSLRNVWRYRYKRTDLGGDMGPWEEATPPTFYLRDFPQDAQLEIEAERVDGDSERLRALLIFDVCFPVKEAAAAIPAPGPTVADPVGSTKGSPTMRPTAASGAWYRWGDGFYDEPTNLHPDWLHARDILRVNGEPFAYVPLTPRVMPDRVLNAIKDAGGFPAWAEGEGEFLNGYDPYDTLGLFLVSNVAGPDVSPEPQKYYVLSTGGAAGFVASLGSLEIELTPDAAYENLPEWDEANPSYNTWHRDGYFVSAEIIVKIGTGFAGYVARSYWGGAYSYRDFAGMRRPEVLGGGADDSVPEARRCYPINNTVAEIGDGYVGFKPGRERADGGVGAGGVRYLRRQWLKDAHIEIPYNVGSVPWCFVINVAVSGRYRMGSKEGKCDRIVFTPPNRAWYVVRSEPGPDSRDYLSPVTHDLDTGLFVPELAYGYAAGEGPFNTTPWDVDIFRYDPGPKRRPPAPKPPPEEPVRDNDLPPVVGWLDAFEVFGETNAERTIRLKRLNPYITFLWDEKKGVFPRLYRIALGPKGKGPNNLQDGRDLGVLMNRAVTLATNIIMTFASEQQGTFFGFARYFVYDPCEPVSPSLLTGPNGEAPLFGFPLVCAWKVTNPETGEVTLTDGTGHEEEISRFWQFAFTMADRWTETADSLLSSNEFRQAWDELLTKAVHMTTVYGSGKLLGFWRT